MFKLFGLGSLIAQVNKFITALEAGIEANKATIEANVAAISDVNDTATAKVFAAQVATAAKVLKLTDKETTKTGKIQADAYSHTLDLTAKSDDLLAEVNAAEALLKKLR